MKCGMSEVQITPWLDCWMPGQMHYRSSQGVLDDLYAKALVLETKEHLAAIIVIDCVDLQRHMVETIRQRVNNHTHIPESHIMVSATHTHTGGPVKAGFAGDENEEYIQFLIKKSADAAILAFRDRKAARIGFGKGLEKDISFNRRYYMKDGKVRTNPPVGDPDMDRPEGPIDPEVLVVRIDDMDGKPIGVVSNFALHLDTVGGVEYSADFAGEISHQVKKTLGTDCVSLFMLGACGNINHVDVSGRIPRTVKQHIRLGRILAAEIMKVHCKIQTELNLSLKVEQTAFPIKLREPSKEQLSWAEEWLATDQGKKLERVMAQQIQILASKQEDLRRDIELQAFCIGEMAMVGLPGELFVEFGLQIKEESPYVFTLINQLCNASGNGYICTEAAHQNGGYEPNMTTSSRWPEETGRLMVTNIHQLLDQCFAQST